MWTHTPISQVPGKEGGVIFFSFSGAIAIPRGFFGTGFGRIHLDDLGCEGSENALINCSHNGELNHNCGHNEDAGVICIGEPSPSICCMLYVYVRVHSVHVLMRYEKEGINFGLVKGVECLPPSPL